jgi:hypothetical protein
MYYTKSYERTIEHLGEISPTLDKPAQFISWAEDMAVILCFIYNEDYDTVTEDIVKAAKYHQGMEDEDEDEDED